MLLFLIRNKGRLYYQPKLSMGKKELFRRQMLYTELYNRVLWCGREAPQTNVNDVLDVLYQLLIDFKKYGDQAFLEDNGE